MSGGIVAVRLPFCYEGEKSNNENDLSKVFFHTSMLITQKY